MTWIQTLDGKKFDLKNPSADMIDPETIIVGLSRMCRFGCHCNKFYSVGQHSVLVCDLVKEPELKLAALLHDAHELYWGFGDIARPAKKLFGKKFGRCLVGLAWRIDLEIARRFGFSPDLFYQKEIKYADDVALATEKRDLMNPAPFEWEPLPDPHSIKIKPCSEHLVQTDFRIRLEVHWPQGNIH